MQYRTVEDVLMRQHGVVPERRKTLNSRLKQLRRLGMPPGSQVGRHARVDYSAEQLYQLAVCLEFLQAGLPPERAVELTIEGWPSFRAGLFDSFENVKDKRIGQWAVSPHVVAVVSLQELHDYTRPEISPAKRSIIERDSLFVVRQFEIEDAGTDTQRAISILLHHTHGIYIRLDSLLWNIASTLRDELTGGAPHPDQDQEKLIEGFIGEIESWRPTVNADRKALEAAWSEWERDRRAEARVDD